MSPEFPRQPLCKPFITAVAGQYHIQPTTRSFRRDPDEGNEVAVDGRVGARGSGQRYGFVVDQVSTFKAIVRIMGDLLCL